MTDAERSRMREELGALVEALDPAQVVLVTGGTRFGRRRLRGERALRGRSPSSHDREATKPTAALDAGAMTHAHIVASTPYERARGSTSS